MGAGTLVSYGTSVKHCCAVRPGKTLPGSPARVPTRAISDTFSAERQGSQGAHQVRAIVAGLLECAGALLGGALVHVPPPRQLHLQSVFPDRRATVVLRGEAAPIGIVVPHRPAARQREPF